MSGRVMLGSSWNRPSRSGPRPELPADDEVVVQELEVVAPSRCAGGSRRPLVALAVAGSLVAALGLAGHVLDHSAAAASMPSRAPATGTMTDAAVTPSVAIVIPAEAESFPDGRIQLRLRVRGPVGTVHVTVSAGPAVLGSGDLDVRGGGDVDAVVPVLAPRFALAAVVTVSWQDSGTGSAQASTNVWVWSSDA